MSKKSAKVKSSSKKASSTKGKKDVAAFVDHIEKSKEVRSKLRKSWNEIIASGKKKGFKFTRQELRDHFKKRYGVQSLIRDDEPDTCVCI